MADHPRPQIWKALLAAPKGVIICLSDRSIRRLCLWPWLIGCVCYLASIAGGYYLHPVILSWLVDSPSSIWSYVVYILAWVLVGLGLLIATMLVSVLVVLLLTGVFQSAIAAHVLRNLGLDPPEEAEGISGLASEVKRSILTEAAKMLWLGPLLLCALLLGLIPFLAPVAIVCASWLLAYQFVDIVLDVYRLRSRDRLRFSVKNGFVLCCYGLTLSACWAIPLVGIVLPPAATAGAAWLLADSAILRQANRREAA